MQTIKYQLIEEGDTFDSIINQYSMNEIDFKRLNSYIRSNYVILGQLVYVLVDEVIPVKIQKNEEYANLVKEIHNDLRNYYISYINNYNDNIIIKKRIEYCLKKLSEHIISGKNEQEILVSLFNNIQDTEIEFIDSLKSKEPKKIQESKQNIKQAIKSLHLFFEKNKIIFNPDRLSSIIETNLLIIAKILNNNLYDTWELLEKNISVSNQ